MKQLLCDLLLPRVEDFRLSASIDSGQAIRGLKKRARGLALAGAGGFLLAIIFGFFFGSEQGAVQEVVSLSAFLLLASLVLCRYSHNSATFRRVALRGVGGGLLLIPFLFPLGHFFYLPYFFPALLLVGGVIYMLLPILRREHARWGGLLGVLLSVLAVFWGVFVVMRVYQTHENFRNSSSFSDWALLLATGCWMGAMISSLGPNHFPNRPFVGTTLQASLLRWFIPLVLILSLMSFFLTNLLAVAGANPAVISMVFTGIATLMTVFGVIRVSTQLGPAIETQVKRSDHQFIQFVNEVRNHGIIIFDSLFRVELWAQGAERSFGYGAQEVLGKPIRSFLVFEEPQEFQRLLDDANANSFSVSKQKLQRKEGAFFWAETYLKPLRREGHVTGWMMMVHDVEELNSKRLEVENSLREKEVIIREIHHRVKNNLQVIVSLLRLQAEHVTDPGVLSLFLESQERVRSMSLVHEFLYQSKNLARVDFAGYVKNLVANLVRVYGIPGDSPGVRVEVENLHLTLDQAVPCGLILVELLTNALKYAYVGKEQGPITVFFRQESSVHYEMGVEDQGVGFLLPPGSRSPETLGLRLVSILAEQLKGRMTLRSSSGVSVRILFPVTVPKKR